MTNQRNQTEKIDPDRYDWERGAIIIPTAQWASFRRGMINVWNRYQLGSLVRAKGAMARVKERVKGKRGAVRRNGLAEWYDAADPSIRNLVVGRIANERTGIREWSVLKTPTKKNLNILKVSGDGRMRFPTSTMTSAVISLSNDLNTVTWWSREGPGSVRHAHGHWMAKELFRRLNGVEWTRGSGGEVVGRHDGNENAIEAMKFGKGIATAGGGAS